MLISDCCGEPANGNEDYGICSSCKEHCDWINDEDDEVIDDDDFLCCEDCDLPDACADFGCAIVNGIRKKPLNF